MSAHDSPYGLVVKCGLDNVQTTKDIVFASVHDCSYDALKRIIDQFLPHTQYAIAYKDHDGEIADITTDEGLADAIEYFQSGSDDLSGSSSHSASSRASSAPPVITVRVQVRLEYDGPALSATGSLPSVGEDHFRLYGGYTTPNTGTSFSDYVRELLQVPIAEEGHSIASSQDDTTSTLILTQCSGCGAQLVDIRYICLTCHEKTQGEPSARNPGYELCLTCIEEKGVVHAIEASASGDEDISSSSPGHQSFFAQAPQRGQLRHAFIVKYWNSTSDHWEDVDLEQHIENSQNSRCSFCWNLLDRESTRYKCFSCNNINACIACYSRIHERHPLHTFLVVPDRLTSERLHLHSTPSDVEQPSVHSGISCAYCALQIIGPRLHCVECSPSLDFCETCEYAGMTENFDSIDGRHDPNTHCWLKMPHPVSASELQRRSRRAYEAAQPPNDHRVPCDGCEENIRGIRYQCASCPSTPELVCNLCESCEEISYIVHDDMHSFFKIPRRVDRPLETPQALVPPLYSVAAGPSPTSGSLSVSDPKGYLSGVQHKAVCDQCVTAIKGEWFRCGNCTRDLCDVCQNVDTHDKTHIFLVIKSMVDMTTVKHTLHNKTIMPYPVYSN
ncbi:hypothetical protein BDN72DRAFT_533577 [Pluteus cervinus]|uniref:Uncharacterized protein n=1 Tax=Pluteus cervinus TaxID=181527 RepID=A0ACD3AYG8_9AGAR|nr:hypothetical protein BDN72DRAFT_533577 [Pluteus cervinus]